MQGLPRMAVMPANKAKIEMTWDTVGLKGTGSHDLVVEDVLVEKKWTFVRGEPSKLSEPFFKYPSLSLATQVLTVVGIGVAAAALEEFEKLAPGKASITGGSEIANRPVTQYEFAQADAEFQAAKSWFYQTMDIVGMRLLLVVKQLLNKLVICVWHVPMQREFAPKSPEKCKCLRV